MNCFWTRFVKPLVEAAAPRRMMEIGADSGWNTERLLAYCRQTGCILEIVDPAPRPALHDVMARSAPASSIMRSTVIKPYRR